MEIAFLLYEGMTALDFVGPHEVLCRLPGAKVKRVAEKAGSIKTFSAGLVLNADYGLADIPKADVLVVPGSGHAATLRDHPHTLEWIKAIHQHTKWTTSVCTGSLILGAAGLLVGLKATSHWTVIDRLKQWGATPIHERVVEDGKVMTSAGVSAGIDMALTLSAKIAGKEQAETLQLAIEYNPHPPFDAGSPEKVDHRLREALRARMNASFEK